MISRNFPVKPKTMHRLTYSLLLLCLFGCATQPDEPPPPPTLIRTQAFSQKEGLRGSLYPLPPEQPASTAQRLREQCILNALVETGFTLAPTPSMADFFLVIGEQSTMDTSIPQSKGSLVLRALDARQVQQYADSGLQDIPIPAAWEVSVSFLSPQLLPLDTLFPYLCKRLAKLAARSQPLQQESYTLEELSALLGK